MADVSQAEADRDRVEALLDEAEASGEASGKVRRRPKLASGADLDAFLNAARAAGKLGGGRPKSSSPTLEDLLDEVMRSRAAAAPALGSRSAPAADREKDAARQGKSNAVLLHAFFASLGRRMGLSAQDAYSRYPLQLREVAATAGAAADPGYAKAGRGRLSFADDIAGVPSFIELLPGADGSTVPHEAAHFFLEVYSHLASQPDAPASVKADMDALLAWFGVRGESGEGDSDLAAEPAAPSRPEDTPEFKAWFGDSNLRNEDGTPLVLYHGTGSTFTRFEPSAFGFTGPGVYASWDPEVANGYAGDGKGGHNVMPIYARGRYIGLRAWSKYVREAGTWQAARERAQADGVDGIMDHDYELAVNIWDPRNIKSAIGNRGTFDPDSDNILEQQRLQQAEAESVAFTSWFADSEVVDGQGRPLRLYHFGSFGEGDNVTPNGPMHFGTEAAARERAFGKRVDDAAKAVRAYTNDGGSTWHWVDGSGFTSEDQDHPGFSDEQTAIDFGVSSAVRAAGEDESDPTAEGVITPAFLSIRRLKRVLDVGGAEGEWDDAIAVARSEGYDGIVYRNKFEDEGSDSYIAFEPTQIKHATANRGTFDPLNPNVLEQERSAFQAWFGASKVVDRNGRPLVAYHGTNQDVSEFDVAGRGANAIGAWFTAPRPAATKADRSNSRSAAANFAATQVDLYGGGDTVLPVHLSISNPKEFDGYEAFMAWVGESNDGNDGRMLRERLQRLGHDGIVIRNSRTDSGELRDDWVAFDPRQVKSAIGNRGTFDPVNPNILEQKRTAFQAWFEGSSVVDASGQPLVLYHGTNQSFDAFDPEQSREDGAIFLSSSPQSASEFALFRTVWAGANVMPVYLSASKLLEVDGQGRAIRDVERDLVLPGMRYGETVRDFARRVGYEGIVFRSVVDDVGPDMPKPADVYAVYDARRVKSAIGNRGTFDPASPNILHQDAKPDRAPAPPAPSPAPERFSDLRWEPASDDMLAARLTGGWTATIMHGDGGPPELQVLDPRGVDFGEPVSFSSVNEAMTAAPAVLARRITAEGLVVGDALHARNGAAFQAWFGASKVVDAEGRPRVVFHGTNQDIRSFSRERLGANTGAVSAQGFFFTEHPQEAAEYASMSARNQVSNAPEREANAERLLAAMDRALKRGDNAGYERLTLALEESEQEAMSGEERGANIMPVYLSIRNPLVLDMQHKAELHDLAEAIQRAKYAGYDGLQLVNVYDPVENRPEAFSTTQWVAFEPTQIKSAIGNRGAFDAASPNILEQRAFHGTPHVGIERFSTDRIGTGEGHKSYDWGLYFTDTRAIAEHYRQALNGKVPSGWSDRYPESARGYIRVVVGEVADGKYTPERAARHVQYANANMRDYPADRLAQEIEDASKVVKGQVYEVEIPDDEHMLDWDKPLAEQPTMVQRALAKLSRLDPRTREDFDIYRTARPSTMGDDAGFYYRGVSKSLGSDQAASEALLAMGIKGIKYLDGQSRDAGAGSCNYVVFSDDEIAVRRSLMQESRAARDDRGDEPEPCPARQVEEDTRSSPSSAPVFNRSRRTALEVWRSMTLEQKRPFHEKFARGYEAYLMEGRAPTPALRRIFSRFRGWLKQIYGSAQALRVELTPAVRGVMGRMLGALPDGSDGADGRPQDAAPGELIGADEADEHDELDECGQRHRFARMAG